MGMVAVAVLAATAADGANAAITETPRRTKSAACAGRRSY
jgi:hypothetical protein